METHFKVYFDEIQFRIKLLWFVFKFYPKFILLISNISNISNISLSSKLK